MTEQEFRAAIRPLVSRHPTKARTDKFTEIFFKALKYYSADALAAFSMAELYTNQTVDDDSDGLGVGQNVVQFPRKS